MNKAQYDKVTATAVFHGKPVMLTHLTPVLTPEQRDKRKREIESQIEFCEYELKGGSYREYRDKGYSGKNTDRPDFQRLLRDIETGLIAKVVVYKLDRISRSILDFAKLMELFQNKDCQGVK